MEFNEFDENKVSYTILSNPENIKVEDSDVVFWVRHIHAQNNFPHFLTGDSTYRNSVRIIWTYDDRI